MSHLVRDNGGWRCHPVAIILIALFRTIKVRFGVGALQQSFHNGAITARPNAIPCVYTCKYRGLQKLAQTVHLSTQGDNVCPPATYDRVENGLMVEVGTDYSWVV